MPGPYSSLMVLRRRASRRPPGPVWTVFGGVEGPVAGVMVVYGPPITHLPPPAVGASPDAAIHDFKGSCRRSVRITVGRSLPCVTFGDSAAYWAPEPLPVCDFCGPGMV